MPIERVISPETALTLADFTSPGLMIPRLRARDAAAAIQELSAALHREGRVRDALPFYQAVLNREFLSGTVTEPGWALPHARIKDLEHSCFALGGCEPPLAWMKTGQPLVSLVFLFAVPETDARDYLNLISGLARLSRLPGLVSQLTQSQSPEERVRVLQQVKLRASQSAPSRDQPA